MNYGKLKENALKSNLVKDAEFVGKYDFPMLKKTTKIPSKAIPFDRLNTTTDCKQWVHFYIDDYKFERIWNNLNRYMQTFKKFYGIIGTDFSTYTQNVGRGLAVVGGSAAAGYLIYRGVRMLPSLVPALWWTIPANLATP